MSVSAATRVREAAEVGPKVDREAMTLLSVGHAVTDTYGHSLLSPMFPVIAARLGLSLPEVAGLPLIMGLSASLLQPVVGLVSDRRPRWCLVALGPLLSALFIGFVGLTRSYAELAVVLFLAGVGTAAYHPQGASLARRAGRGSSLAMSAFTVGGNIGFGIAPLLGAFYLRTLGLDRLYVAAIPAILFAAFMFVRFYAGEGMHTVPKSERESGPPPPGNRRALAALTGTVMIRSVVPLAMTTFLPFLVQQRFPPADQLRMSSIAVSALLLASAVSGPVGGHLSDRFGRRPVMIASFLLAPWPFLLALQSGGWAMVALLALGSFVLMLPHPGNVIMAQEFLPRSGGIAASLVTGLAWGIAQLVVLPLGHLAEVTSLSATLTGLCFVPLLGAALVLPIPERPDSV
jgi:FSR family fosmidomycin resistance protein-like MFS transporter